MLNRYTCFFLCSALLTLGGFGCKSAPSNGDSEEPVDEEKRTGDDAEAEHAPGDSEQIEALADRPEDSSHRIATFAGGCFWCMEPPFDHLDGVVDTIVGYTGGREEHPTYEEVSSGKTGHAEAVRIYYEPDEIGYRDLLEVFWRNIDPTQSDGQFADRGAQYRSAIFYHDEEQRALAERSKERLEKSGPFDEPIVTEIEPAKTFWRAETYHQNFYRKKPQRYKSYRRASGREGFLERTWGDESP